jgi:predicted nucleotidyltransferase
MASSRTRVKSIIARFLRELQQHIEVQQAYLFGSCARRVTRV